MEIHKMGSCYLSVISDGKQVAVVDMQNGVFHISFMNPIEIHLAQAVMEIVWHYKANPW